MNTEFVENRDEREFLQDFDAETDALMRQADHVIERMERRNR